MTRRPDLAGLRVLVAEDETLVAMEVEALLLDFGCEIVGPVASVDAAVAEIRGGRLDGALLDLNLHGRTVLPAVEELLGRSVPFILVTGYGRSEADPPALRDAARLGKPFSAEQLRAAMAEVLFR